MKIETLQDIQYMIEWTTFKEENECTDVMQAKCLHYAGLTVYIQYSALRVFLCRLFSSLDMVCMASKGDQTDIK